MGDRKEGVAKKKVEGEKNEQKEEKENDSDGDVEDEREKRSQHLGQAIINDAEGHEVRGKITRYETALLSAHARTWEMLLRVQHMRREEQSHTIDATPNETKTVMRFRPKLLNAD